jgi:hypothetical protein
MLDLCPAALTHQFTGMEEAVSLIERTLGKEQLEENVELEKSFSAKDDDGEIGLEVSGDTRWDKRGTGSNYNSDSGCHLITGNMTKRVLAACPMSRRCAKCEHDKEHPKELCSKNYDGSSKGMEAYGASQNVNRLFDNLKCYIKKYVSDDDLSTKSVLRWPFKQAFELYQVEWPRTGARGEQQEEGQRPFEHSS